jgi:hypothetical protein
MIKVGIAIKNIYIFEKPILCNVNRVTVPDKPAKPVPLLTKPTT